MALPQNLETQYHYHYDYQKHQSSPSPEDYTNNMDNNVDNLTPIRYASLDRVYSAAPSLCVTGSSNVMSKKVKARKLTIINNNNNNHLRVYSRRRDGKRKTTASFYESILARSQSVVVVKAEVEEVCECSTGGVNREGEKLNFKKRRRVGPTELLNLGVNSAVLDGPRLRDSSSRFQRHHSKNISNNLKNNCNNNFTSSNGKQRVIWCKKKRDSAYNLPTATTKKWLRLSFDDADPKTFIGLQCKVYWPLDADWYSGRVVGYNLESNRHNVEYEDGDKEDLILSNEKVKFFISTEDMERLKLSCSVNSTDNDGYDYNEMLVLAASLDDCQELDAGDIIWAKLTGHAMWPAIVVDESLVGDRKGLNKISRGRSVPVQFFGTHDFARIKTKQVTSFLKGLLSSFHLKCKKPQFTWSLEEAKMYLSEQKLPRRMLELQNAICADGCESTSSEDEGSTDSGEDSTREKLIQKIPKDFGTTPYVIGDLQILSLGKIVKDSEYFQDDRYICPEGYTAVRKFTSLTDPCVCTLYKMEVLRDAESKIRPLFKVTSDNGEQFKGSTPSACWDKIYKRIQKMQNGTFDGCSAEGSTKRLCESGSDMFGLSDPEVIKLIQGLSKSGVSSKFTMFKWTSGRYRNLPVGYRPVRVDWKDLDKCNVCHMDEEYENNLFLQCDKCRMMVHARCYGELEPIDGVLWLCNLCRPGAPESPPPCCLCPVIGGAMKLTTDGCWAHLACAIWIPETCLSDVKRMEPIDGLNRINKDRWKLLCSICGVSYGACIQCSNNSCRVAYHPLCARAAGLCVELEDEDRLHLLSVDDDEENQCIRLLSFCKKHRQPSNDRSATDDRIGRVAWRCSDYIPPINPSGCARSEPYNYFGRRGRKEPEALTAASLKRLFIENRPYLVGGYLQHEMSGNVLPSNGVMCSKFSSSLHRLKASQIDAPNNILSMAEKYKHMRETFRKRLAFGKSGIHGFGIFSKHPHRAGDMVIEYTGELVRPPIADRREHFIYNSLVGAGTYMFRINDERVIDATRAGSIAHLINHSCEPNCYSRMISVNGNEHIIIFAKRDIKQGEELTYDYRFFSIDEQLACYCGFPRCRGVVNDTEAEEQMARFYAPRTELKHWKGD
ncbi:PWWP domain-containing protein/SET domain-containing protein/FYRN domain-containing protein/FYRC domain-containing protein/PHD_2 domain-containing protein/zf-HC5HC2H_2 domain-containing protein [Cephalotus follicularis]|uniref:PWWP domain-containing protein/SET domain-containing protein/FYRN domain-containing protein/FYRC domain-containing protein/PHD_2 domain-containing protein/zf-HC5HC2H_2 domain-containing protein n=1 Tax=Cephalotus follicularis TaxID=3775 RepID=A0A1Q3ATL1_CEPFO|nr:PWWP domain-containing protein/SET domain-containing protein/FYRN domain-containing protein/FYRC domain-containing protein/PHD_2 domain-containing protein/zf-HC5HC2H_2 domain-containing protein [Cephalotus follicularis]